MKGISAEVWEQARRAATKAEETSDGGGITTRELATSLGQSLSVTQRQLGEMVDAGLWEYVRHVTRNRRDGYQCQIPTYRPVKKGKGKA